jgi:protein phosphatase
MIPVTRSMEYAPGNAQHIGSRSEQQDAFGFSEWDRQDFVRHGGRVAVLADGMGGMDQGAAASRTAVTAFLEAYGHKTPDEGIAEALLRAAHGAHRAVSSLASAKNVPGNIGTTLVAAVVHDAVLHWVSVGDSALYLYRGDTLSCLTTPHNYGTELDAQAARGDISVMAASTDPQRQALTSYIGAESLDEIDLNSEPYPLLPRDRLIIASDGLFRTLADHEIVARLKADPPDPAISLLNATLSKRNPNQDNVTILTIQVEADATPQELSSLSQARSSYSRLVLPGAVIAVVVLMAAGWYWRQPSPSTAKIRMGPAADKERFERSEQMTLDSLPLAQDQGNSRPAPGQQRQTAIRP